ncbi:MAG: ion transporter [Firmicutes bacterium]|nr:ion transporter [Bacillota bacterium]
MRKRIYEILDGVKERDKAASAYSVFMTLIIMLSLVPLAFKQAGPAFIIMDRVAVTVFIIDYILRLATADFKLKRGKDSFYIYPLTPLAIFDLLCILPSLHLLNGSFRLFKLARLYRTLLVFRVFKFMRYSRSVRIIWGVFRAQKKPLLTVTIIALTYVLLSALVVFNVEPDTFDTFFDAIYWAVVSLTTVGYGDIYPVSTLGRIVTMVSAVFGMAIIALPAGIITAGFMQELERQQISSGQQETEPEQED